MVTPGRSRHSGGVSLIPHLLAPPVQVNPVVGPGDVGGTVAFETMLREGVLTPVRRARAVARHQPVTTRIRILALAHDVPPRSVVGRESASWVFLGGPAPDRLTVLYPPKCHRPNPSPTLTSHQAVLRPEEILTLGQIRITTPARTAADVALFEPFESAVAGVRSLVSGGHTTARAILRALATRTGDAGYGRALDVVRALSGTS